MRPQARQTYVSSGSMLPLLITFIVLKLTHTIDWSWWWVLAPLWIPLGLAVVVFVFVFVGLTILSIADKPAKSRIAKR